MVFCFRSKGKVWGKKKQCDVSFKKEIRACFKVSYEWKKSNIAYKIFLTQGELSSLVKKYNVERNFYDENVFVIDYIDLPEHCISVKLCIEI